MARAAPQQCIFYFSWAGAAQPDAKSKNRAERFLADPEIRHMRAEALRRYRLLLAFAAKSGNSQTLDGAAKDFPFWSELLATHQGVCFIGSYRPEPQTPQIDGGLVVNVGRSQDEVAAKLAQYQKLAAGGIEVVHAGSRTEYRLKDDGSGVSLRWTLDGKYLIVALGKESPEGIAKRMAGKEPGWLTAIGKDLPVERRAVVLHLECQPLLAALASGDAERQKQIDATGASHLRPDPGHRLGGGGFRQPRAGGVGPCRGSAAAPDGQSPVAGR